MGWSSLHVVEYSRVNDFLSSKNLPAWKVKSAHDPSGPPGGSLSRFS